MSQDTLDIICKSYLEVIRLQPGLTEHILKGIKCASFGQPNSPFTGRLTTPRRLLRWLEEHPDFVAEYYRRGWVKPGNAAPQGSREDQAPGRFCGSPRRRASRSSSGAKV